MIAPADLIRALHLAASVLPAGLYLFAVLIARPAARASPDGGDGADELRRWSIQALRWCAAVAFVSGALWLGIEAMSMSGEPLGKALAPSVVGAVLGTTLFGRLWLLRGLLLAALAACVVRSIARQKSATSDAIGLTLSLGFAVTLAWAGHAAGVEGREGAALLAAQIAHVLATAGWLGALPALAMLLALARTRPGALGFAAAATRRFSPLGMTWVAVLVGSGIVNSWVLVGTIPALVGTAYGRLLLIKLALVLAMLGLAALNRLWLTPDLDRHPRRAVRALAATISLETALGMGVLVIVGALSASTPGAHEQPLWPFRFTLSWEPVIFEGQLDPPFAIALAVAAAGLVAAIAGAAFRRWAIAGVGLVAGLFAADRIIDAMQVPAYPTSFMTSPVPFTADAVAHGAALYQETCLVCHGATGRGDGPAAAAFPPGEATVVGHLLGHSQGELFWQIGHGIPGTPMPAFEAETTPDQRWTLIQFLRAQAQATQIEAMSWHVSPTAGVPAPDFAFQIDGGGLETLADERGQAAVLLVLYSRPGSNARLEQLAAAASTLPGLRIVAVPLEPGDAEGDHPDPAGMLARPAPKIAAAYALYGWRIGPDGPQPARHTEFLIDRSGTLRARWHLSEGGGWADVARLKTEVETLAREPFRPAELAHHVHG
ncbi:MAG TPA: copper homeostasis membrane protein CopD [Alphaproteobacteria bacterium]|nr:copper homeostasis membrane protein CopD [Alphaproteobacteria bacterium]